jgi:hypothetical protein
MSSLSERSASGRKPESVSQSGKPGKSGKSSGRRHSRSPALIVDFPAFNIGRGKAGLAEHSGRAGKAQEMRGIAYTRQNNAARESQEDWAGGFVARS